MKSESSITNTNTNTLGNVLTKSESFIDINDLFSELQVDDILDDGDAPFINEEYDDINQQLVYKTAVITDDQATNLYYYLKNNFREMDEANGMSITNDMDYFGCENYLVNPNEFLFKGLSSMINHVLSQMDVRYTILSIYLNFYKDGQLFIPSHTYRDKCQLVITLGKGHILRIEDKNLYMQNGDAILSDAVDHTITRSNNNEMQMNITAYLC